MQSIEEAIENNNYKEIFELYLNLLRSNPNIKSQNEERFIDVLYNYALVLEEEKPAETIINAYREAITEYPNSVFLYNNLGEHLMRLERFIDAKMSLDVACRLNPYHLQSRNNLDHAKATLIPRWHFRMLNDSVRNHMYFNAIKKRVDEGFNRVVDIGAGCGLLSMFASNTNAINKIFAIEESEILCKMARSIFALNDISNIKLFEKPSNQISVNAINANLLVTEIFDAALFGEHVLETLMYALHFVMNRKPGWSIIPSKAVLYVTGINSKDVMKKHRLLHNIADIKLSNLCLTQERTEPYEGENLAALDVSYVTKTETIATIDFGDYGGLVNLFINGRLCRRLPINIVEDSFIDAFAVWFDLHLDEANKISTNPFDGNVKCWEQAVFYLDHKIPVKKDTELNVSVDVINGCLKINVPYTKDCGGCFRVSQDAVLLLNDLKIVEVIRILAQKMGNKNVRICDTSAFPLLGILLAKNGVQVKCFTKSDVDKKFFAHIFTENDINVEIISDDLVLKKTVVENCDFCFFQPILRSGIFDANFFNYIYGGSMNCIFLPDVVKPIFQVIECDYIDYYNKVDDKNTCGFKVAEVFNEYTVSQHLLFKKHIPFKPLTETVEGANLLSSEDFSEHFTLLARDCGRANAVLYWFECSFLGLAKMNTNECDYYSRACFIMEKPLWVCKNKSVVLEVKFSKGLLGLRSIVTDDKCIHHH